MNIESFHWNNTEDKQIFASHYGVDKVRATAICLHGMGEHSGRYGFLAEALAQRDIELFTYDHIGHGRSQGERAYIRDFKTYVDDFSTFVQMVRKRRNDDSKPLYLIAHSMGTTIALQYSFTHPDTFDKMVFSGTCLYPGDGLPTFLIPVVGLVSRIFSKSRWVKFDPADICKNPETQNAYREDPLVENRGATNLAGALVLKAMISARKRLSEIKTPLLLIHGGTDKICLPKGAEQLYAEAQSPDKHLEIYDGYRHEILNEKIRPKILDRVLSFLEEV